MVLISLSFCLSVSFLISLSNLNEILSVQSNLGSRLFHFITLNISYNFLLACRVSPEKLMDNLMGFPLCVIYCFLLAAFSIFSLYLIFASMFLHGFILYKTLCTSWTWETVSFPMLGKFLTLNFQIFSQTLSLLLESL